MTAGQRIDRALTWESGRIVLHVADCPHARAAAAAGAPVVTLLDCAHDPASLGAGRRIDRCRCLTAEKERAPQRRP